MVLQTRQRSKSSSLWDRRKVEAPPAFYFTGLRGFDLSGHDPLLSSNVLRGQYKGGDVQ